MASLVEAPWVEKYRPRSLEDISAQDNTISILKRTLESANLPHMLFYGPPGTGKTSTILALAKDLFGPELMKSRVLELNASDERGISIVREKVKNFAKTTVSNGDAAKRKGYPAPPYKIIILDEADSMTQEAQSALRRVMENYSRITRFCLICNFVTRIIDPVASRCSKFRFRPLDSVNAKNRLQYICQQESLECTDDALDRLLALSAGDLRRAITFLQSAGQLAAPTTTTTTDDEGDVDMSKAQPTATITTDIVLDVTGSVPDKVLEQIIKAAENPNIKNQTHVDHIRLVVQDVIRSGWSASQLLSQLHDLIAYSDSDNNISKPLVSLALSQAEKRLADGSDEELELLDLIVSIAEATKKT